MLVKRSSNDMKLACCNGEVGVTAGHRTQFKCYCIDCGRTNTAKAVSCRDTDYRSNTVCMLQGGSFVIYDLHFDCRYVVRVQPVSSSGLNGPISHISFPTLSCREIPVKSGPDPDCPVHSAHIAIRLYGRVSIVVAKFCYLRCVKNSFNQV